MSGLLDFLQAASNSVAGNVTGPVDLITLALRKAGVPVPEDSVGTSAWAKQKGLMRDVAPGAARVAGETAGILGPMMAVHYAPQIAGGLLKAAENAAAPRTLNTQTGAIVWHGSPHKFDKFDSSKIGTGEGAQAYGHGLYLAEAPDVAMTYQPRDMKFEAALMKKSELAQRTGNYPAAQVYEDFLLHKTPDEIGKLINEAGYSAGDLAKAKAALEFAKKQYFSQRSGALYKVDLPDDAIARMLDWDAALEQQPQAVREAIYKAAGQGKWGTGASGERVFVEPPKAYETGSEALGKLRRLMGEINAEHALRDAGVPGIRYLDGSSRSAGEGTRNFVIFPGNEDLLTILERNGVPIR